PTPWPPRRLAVPSAVSTGAGAIPSRPSGASSIAMIDVLWIDHERYLKETAIHKQAAAKTRRRAGADPVVVTAHLSWYVKQQSRKMDGSGGWSGLRTKRATVIPR